MEGRAQPNADELGFGSLHSSWLGHAVTVTNKGEHLASRLCS